jgi:hypothetical protein
MLAESEQLPSSTLTPTPVPLLSATLIYNPEADPGLQFTWETGTETGQSVLFVEEAGTIVTITLEGATFAATPITFISPSSNFTRVPPSSDTELSFEINNVPLSYFGPLILSFNVDADGVNGISSPPLLLALPPISTDSASITLQYSLSDGSFTLDSMPVLASLDILTNSIVPFTITFNLQSDPPDPSVQFNPATPFIGPTWMVPGSISNSGTALPISISSDATRFASFQFVLDVGGSTVTSPDPIIINATIGDG